jgi:shikimate kinase
VKSVGKPDVVYLVGFMGAGKTRVGNSLARILGYTFLDLDAEIETRAGERIREIFARCGEARFREMEREELERVSRLPRRVIALGGGAFCAAENRDIVSRTGTSVWLDAPLDTLLSRIGGDDSRPLLSSRAQMDALLESRRPLYAQADIRIDVSTLRPDQIARRIARHLKCGASTPRA